MLRQSWAWEIFSNRLHSLKSAFEQDNHIVLDLVQFIFVFFFSLHEKIIHPSTQFLRSNLCSQILWCTGQANFHKIEVLAMWQQLYDRCNLSAPKWSELDHRSLPGKYLCLKFHFLCTTARQWSQPWIVVLWTVFYKSVCQWTVKRLFEADLIHCPLDLKNKIHFLINVIISSRTNPFPCFRIQSQSKRSHWCSARSTSKQVE